MPTILEIANADRNLSSLIKGLKAASLEETLNGIGPFTILAPVNLAFGNLNAPESFDNLVDQSKKNSRLSDILTFHVITGKKLVKDLRDGQKLPTVNGKEVILDVPPQLVRDRVMVPLRFIGEALGAFVKWNPSMAAVTISTFAPPK